MNKEQAKRIIINTFENQFEKMNFVYFLKNLLKNFEERSFVYEECYFPDEFKQHINSLEIIGTYTTEDREIDLLIAQLKKTKSLYRARTMQRNFIAWYLERNKGIKLKDAALVAFVPPDSENWRFSLVKMDYRFEETPSGKVKVKQEFTPARRWSFLVGKNEKSHTAQSRFLPILEDDNWRPTLNNLEEAFNVEKVTQEFFEAYRYTINEVIIKSFDKDIDFNKKHSFAQQLLSRILFIYFLQKKGWLKWKNYEQDTNYIKNLWVKYKEYIQKNKQKKNTFYSIWLSSLFFGAFNKKSFLIDKDLPEEIQESFRIMPFLNGGLFTKNELDELGLNPPDSVFEWIFEPDLTENDKKKGFLETFNFTIDESLPVDVEVAIDPEMLGKVYESLIAEEERGISGVFYTPKVEIEMMCRLSLVEYLYNETNVSKTEIIDFVFNPHSIHNLDIEKAKTIRNALNNVKIVDPAVGSASFLVGMMNILVELHSELTKRLERREENLFALKQKIILENLYGVDVKEWAVMVGELRLWLSLIIETDEKYMDIYTKPLLPNLSFKIRQGDSLVEEIGGIQIALRGNALKSIPPKVKSRIAELIDRKREFFSSQRSANLKEIEEIERLEQDIFIEILESKISKIENRANSLQNEIPQLKNRKDVFGNLDKKFFQIAEEKERQLKELEAEREKYRRTIENLKKKTRKDYFLWEVDFAEVFAEEGGFDIVIGNPPYVRQELIAPPLENQSYYTVDEWRELKAQYKEKLISSAKAIWKDIKIDKKSDLYVYFYYHGLSLLREKGIFCFINSNSWLDVGYGAGLQEFLLKNMKPIYIIDNLKRRSFKESDVNTVIVLVQRPDKQLDDYTIKFVAFKKPFEDVGSADVIKRIESYNQPVFDDEDFRLFPKTKKELLLEGVDTDVLQYDYKYLPYIGNKWGGKYLRAPEIYFKILEKGKGKLVRLGDIAEVRRGFTTGANEFFYLKPIGMSVKEVVEIAEKNPDALIPVRNGAGWEGEIEARFLKPFLFSLKEVKNYQVEVTNLKNLILICAEKIQKGKILEYVKWGEKRGLHKRPSVKGRNLWYSLPHKSFPDFVSNRFLGERFAFPIIENILVCDVFFVGEYFNKTYKNIQTALINSTFSFLSLEVIARKTYGIGVAYIYGPEINNLFLLNLEYLSKDSIDILINMLKSMKNRPIRSIFTELGFDSSKPIREQEPNPLPDRKALDDIVFDSLGLTEEERKEVYWAVAELVKNRLEKANNM